MRRPDPGAVPANLAAEPQPGVGWERVDVHFSGKGLRAHGGFELDLAWEGGTLAWATLRSTQAGPCRVRASSTFTVRISAFAAVD